MAQPLAGSSFVDRFKLYWLRIQELSARESTEHHPPSKDQFTLGLLCAQLDPVFPTSTHCEFSRMFAAATDADLQALAESGVYLGEMYPRSNSTRPQKLLPLLKKLRAVHHDDIVSLEVSAVA